MTIEIVGIGTSKVIFVKPNHVFVDLYELLRMDQKRRIRTMLAQF